MPSRMAIRNPVATICADLARVAGSRWRSIYTIRTLAASECHWAWRCGAHPVLGRGPAAMASYMMVGSAHARKAACYHPPLLVASAFAATSFLPAGDLHADALGRRRRLPPGSPRDYRARRRTYLDRRLVRGQPRGAAAALAVGQGVGGEPGLRRRR